MSAHLITAAIALVWSESGAAAQARGDDLAIHEPWPEMDALIAAMDEARPGWRAEPVVGETA